MVQKMFPEILLGLVDVNILLLLKVPLLLHVVFCFR